MATLNRVTLIGRLTDNPEPPRVLPNTGSTVVKFSLAVSKPSKKDPQSGQWINDPNPLYIDCEAFTRPDDRRRLTDVISQYCTKGKQVYIEGKLQLDRWEDKNNPGQKRSKHKIVIEEIQFLDGPAGGGGQDGGGGGYGGGAGGGGYKPAGRPQPQQQQYDGPPDDFPPPPNAPGESDIPF